MRYNRLKKGAIASIIIAIALTFTCCASPTANQASGDNDSLVPLYKPRYAERFELFSKGDSTVVLRIENPWQGAQNIVLDYTLVRAACDSATAPNTIAIPLRRAIAMSSSYIAFLDALSATDIIVGVSGRDFIFNESIGKSSVTDVGYGGNLNYESIVSLRADAMLAYEVGGENSATATKLTQMGVPQIIIADYLESTPLGRAEWIVVFGALTGNTQSAIEQFLEIEDRYLDIGELAAGVDSRPKIMLNSPYRDTWYMPGDRSYMVRLIEDAGGEYLGRGTDSDTSRPISSESAMVMLAGADLWLNPGMVTTLAELHATNPRMAHLKVAGRGTVFNNNARTTIGGGSDFWESAVVRPDMVLSDMVRIMHPELLPNHQLYYFIELK